MNKYKICNGKKCLTISAVSIFLGYFGVGRMRVILVVLEMKSRCNKKRKEVLRILWIEHGWLYVMNVWLFGYFFMIYNAIYILKACFSNFMLNHFPKHSCIIQILHLFRRIFNWIKMTVTSIMCEAPLLRTITLILLIICECDDATGKTEHAHRSANSICHQSWCFMQWKFSKWILPFHLLVCFRDRHEIWIWHCCFFYCHKETGRHIMLPRNDRLFLFRELDN